MSAISDLLMGSMAQGLDPNAGITRDYAAKVIEEKDVQVVAAKRATMDLIRQDISKAKAEDAPTSVIDAYERLLARLSS